MMHYNLLKKQYWKFLFKSTNQHGVHSPFVYELVTLCFYKKRKQFLLKQFTPPYTKPLNPKHSLVLNDFIDYFNITKIAHQQPTNHPLTQIIKTRKNINITAICDAELTYINPFQDILENLNALKPNGIIIIETPYKNMKLWDSLKKSDAAHVVVDTYSFGFIFNRKQQAKEEFFVRL